MRKNMEIKAHSTYWFSMKSMRLWGKEGATIAVQVILSSNIAAKDDVVNQLLTNLDGV
jgi:hypothetical protein